MGSYQFQSLEKAWHRWDKIKGLGKNFFQLTYLMAKGANLVTERKKLLSRLGEDFYQQWTESPSEIKMTPLRESLLNQIERITKRIEGEEKRIQGIQQPE